MKKRAVLAVLVLGACALVAASAAVTYPRIHRARRLHAAIAEARAATGEARSRAYSSLLDFEETETVLAFLDLERGGQSTYEMRCALQLFALTPEPRDRRVGDTIESELASPTCSTARRFELLLALDELRAPTFPSEPAELAKLERRTIGGGNHPPNLDAAVRELGFTLAPCGDFSSMYIGVPITDRPWHILVRLAQRTGLRFTVEGSRVEFGGPWWGPLIVPGKSAESLQKSFEEALKKKIVVVPPAELNDLDLRDVEGTSRHLRVLARMSGCEVRERDASTLEIVQGMPTPNSEGARR